MPEGLALGVRRRGVDPCVTQAREGGVLAAEEDNGAGARISGRRRALPGRRTVSGVLLGPVGPIPGPGVVMDLGVLWRASHPAEEDHVAAHRVVGQAGKASPGRVVLGMPLGPIV